MLAGAVLVVGGCAGHPIPMQVESGGTVMLPVTGELYHRNPPAGATVLADPLTYDDQRGELIIRLTPVGGGTSYDHTPRYVTGVMPDPASEAGITEHNSVGQFYAVFDVDAPTGTYDITLKRVKRVLPGSPPGQEYGSESDFYPSADAPPFGPLVVISGTGSSTPLDLFAADDPSTAAIAESSTDPTPLAGLAGRPMLVLVVGDEQSTANTPAAFEAEISYPQAKVAIENVAEILGSSGGNLVAYEDDEAGTLTVRGVSPDRDLVEVGIGFSLVDPVDEGRVTNFGTEFSIDTYTSYDLNGDPVGTPPVTPSLVWED